MENWYTMMVVVKLLKHVIYLAFFLDAFYITAKIKIPEERSITLYSNILQSFPSKMTGKAITERNYCNIKGDTVFISFLLLTFIYNVVDNNHSNFINE